MIRLALIRLLAWLVFGLTKVKGVTEYRNTAIASSQGNNEYGIIFIIDSTNNVLDYIIYQDPNSDGRNVLNEYVIRKLTQHTLKGNMAVTVPHQTFDQMMELVHNYDHYHLFNVNT